jgi:hypothetical protein
MKNSGNSPILPIMGLILAVPFFQANCAKVRFIDPQDAKLGFRVLYRSRLPIDCYGNFTYGLSSLEQLKSLDESRIPYEKVG